MKNKLIILCAVLYSQLCFSQANPSLKIELSNSLIKEISYNENFKSFSKISMGVEIYLKKGDLSALFTFGYLYNLKYYNEFLKNSFVGGSLTYRCFRDISNRFSPYFKIDILSEIGRSNRKKLLDVDFLYPIDNPIPYGPYGGPPYQTIYYSDFYEGTPFFGCLTTGCDFRIINNLHLDLGVGYGLRIIKTKYAEWGENDDVNEILKDKALKIHYFHMFMIELGLSYTIPFHKSN